MYQELISAIKVPSAGTLWLRLQCCPGEQSWDELCSSMAWTADRGRCVGLLGGWKLCWDSWEATGAEQDQFPAEHSRCGSLEGAVPSGGGTFCVPTCMLYGPLWVGDGEGLHCPHLSNRKLLLQVFAWLAIAGWAGSFAICLSQEMLCLLLKAFDLKECVSNAGRGQSSARGNC